MTLFAALLVMMLASVSEAQGICQVETSAIVPLPPRSPAVRVAVTCPDALSLTGGGQSCGIPPGTVGLNLSANAYPDSTSQWICSWSNESSQKAYCKCDAICCALTGDTPLPPSGCAHSLCEQGPPLGLGCDACVEQICACDPYCCEKGWDSYCVFEAQEICNLPCAATGACLPVCQCPAD